MAVEWCFIMFIAINEIGYLSMHKGSIFFNNTHLSPTILHF